MKQILSKSIVLIGLMGSGKSAVGEVLSKRMGVPLSDTDKIIEEEVGKKIFQIFNDSGEKYFRQVEEKVVGKVLSDTAHIISTGGGSILSPKTRNLIKHRSCSIWVKCNVNIIMRRILNQEKRPLLANNNIIDTLTEKNKKRIKFYRQADIHVLNEDPNLEITVDAIIENLFLNKVINTP